ncbi:MAG: hypothetical protein ABI036_07295 [Fibrobacteria bacterium]
MNPAASPASTPDSPLSAPASPWRQSLAAARANLVPGLVLQAFALCLFLAYYFHPPSHRVFDVLAGWKAHWGWRYALLSTALFGGLIPFLVLRANPRTRWETPYSHGLFLVLFWGFKGLEVDLFYRLQTWMFGDVPDFRTIACKVAVDQLIYAPWYSTSMMLVLLYWKDAGFSFSRLRRLAVIPFLRANLPKAVVGLWAVWIPALILIYGLPAALQLPLFNIVLCFYALLIATLTRRDADTH